MPQMKTVLSYSDPGHGWAKVKISDLIKLNIIDKITPYSYMRGEYAYLEEDCDLSVYCRSLDERKIQIKWKHHSGNRRSRIRDYDSFNAIRARAAVSHD